jgi:hypothetical protein
MTVSLLKDERFFCDFYWARRINSLCRILKYKQFSIFALVVNKNCKEIRVGFAQSLCAVEFFNLNKAGIFLQI